MDKDGNLAVKGDLTVEGTIENHSKEGLMPVGSIIAYAGKEVPKGWLICDGGWVLYNNDELKKTYKNLVEVLGVEPKVRRWETGGSGMCFILPDLRERFIVGVNPENEKYHLNKALGEENVTLSPSQMPKHRHGFLYAWEKNQNEGWVGDWADKTKAWRFQITDREPDPTKGKIDYPYNKDSSDKRPMAMSFAGNNEPHNNMPPYYALYYIIKY